MSILFLFLALASSLSIAVLLKVFEIKGVNRVVMISSNYIAAGSLGLIFLENVPIQPGVWPFGILLGLFFVVAFITFSKAIKEKGIASSVTIGRLSLSIPVLFSIILWGEQPMVIDIICLIGIFVIILFWEGGLSDISVLLISVFILFGAIDSSVKYFKTLFPANQEGIFLVLIFYSAATWSWIYLLMKKIPIKRKDLFFGMILGVPNYFSTFFLLKALEIVPAYITFPFVNLGLILFSGIIGHLFFKEKLNRRKLFLMGLGMVSVFVLTAKF